MNDHGNAPADSAAPDTFRTQRVGRRGVLRAGGFAALAAGLWASAPAAFAAATTKNRKATTTAKKTATKTPTTSAATTTAAPSTESPKHSPASGTLFPETMELQVTYTFAASGGRVRNPYSAIWIEDPSGKLVRTFDLTVELGRGLRWLNDLTRWYRVDAARIAAGGTDDIEIISSATRVPGTYTATWDGRDQKGQLVAQGAYVLYVEAAREKGPYEIVKADITVGTAAFEKSLGSNGELTNVTAKFRARG